MDKKYSDNQKENQRQYLIDCIIKALSRLGERELDLIVHFIKGISE